MKLAALFSGGKDSTFAIYKAKSEEHDIKCLVTFFPKSSESTLFHYPNVHLTRLQAKSMEIPHAFAQLDSDNTNLQVNVLERTLKQAKNRFHIDGLVYGGILSEFQKKKFEKICSKLKLQIISPLWKMNQKEYMYMLIESKFQFIITSVSAGGLDETWLGTKITNEEIDRLEKLSITHGFNLSFEGGEAETLVTNCPLFSSPLKILKSNKIWDGYRGRLEITEAILEK